MKVKAFGSYNLPYALGEDKRMVASLAGARTILGAAGYWDDLGDLVVLRPGLVEVKLAFYDDDSWTDVDSAMDTAKRALFEERALLKLAAGDGSGDATRQALARCLSFDEVWSYDKPRLVIASAKFELLQPHWDAVDQSAKVGVTGSFEIDNSDSTCRTERTLQIQIFGVLNTVFTLQNETNGMSFIYDASGAGSIPAGSYLEVDCGALTVECNGEDRWSRLTLGDNQIGFMALDPQVNEFTTSPAAVLLFYWYESYL